MATTEHRRRRCRLAGQASTTAPGTVFLERATARLGRGCAVLAGFFVLVAVLEATVPHLLGLSEHRGVDVASALVLGALCAAAAMVIRQRVVCQVAALRLGLAIELVGGAVIAFSIYFAPLVEAREFTGITGFSLWVVVMPFLVPLGRGPRWIASLLSASLPLVVVGLIDPLAGHGTPGLELAAQVALPNWLCGLLGVAISHQVVAWGTALTQARHEVENLGSYQLIEKLGEGGMGEVWRAEHRLLARPAAVKFVRRSELMDPRAVARFEREALATARLTSPHTVRIYDYGVDEEGRFFYVMELLDGLDLETWLERHGPMPPGRVVHLGIQICRSLAEAHDHGLIHRDIKPANIYCCRLGGEHDVVKVLDFGLVLHEDHRARPEQARLTEEGFVTGTPGFLAPEAARGRGDLDLRVDVYSLGCVLFLLLTGQSVIDERDKTPMEVMMAHIKAPRRRPAELGVVGVPPALEALILDCVAVDAADRPDDMRSVARRLRDCGAEPWSEDQAAAWWAEHGPQTPATRSITRSDAPTETTRVAVR